jgi:hypothetical protein
MQVPADHLDYYGRGHRPAAALRVAPGPLPGQRLIPGEGLQEGEMCDVAAASHTVNEEDCCSDSEKSAASCMSSKPQSREIGIAMDKENAGLAQQLLPPPRMALDPVQVRLPACTLHMCIMLTRNP